MVSRGAVGVAVFGALIAHRLRHTIPAALADAGVPPEALASAGDATRRTPAELAALPQPLHTAVVTGFADAFQTAFLAAVPLALAGLAVVLLLREVPLRRRHVPDGE